MEPERDKDVPNKHNPQCTRAGVMQQRTAACACLPVLLKKDNKNKADSDAGGRGGTEGVP